MSKLKNFEFKPVDRMLTIPQTAEVLQLSPRTVANMIASGSLPSVKIGAARRITADAVRTVAKAGSDTGRRA